MVQGAIVIINAPQDHHVSVALAYPAHVLCMGASPIAFAGSISRNMLGTWEVPNMLMFVYVIK